MALTKVTSGMRTLATDEVLTANINDDAVTTAKVLDDAVTTAKVLDDAVTAAKLADSAYLANRNMVINGAMQVAQRSTSVQKQYDSSNGYFTCDRVRTSQGALDNAVWTMTQDAHLLTGPTGFPNSWKVTVDTAETALAADEQFTFQYNIEAKNCQNLAYGTSGAKTTTTSFWVKSDVTGVYSLTLYSYDANRSIGGTYTISVADTWEYKTVTLVGDTAGTGINNDTGVGVTLYFALTAGTDRTSGDNTSWSGWTTARAAYGQTANVLASATDYWQITGLQFEIGSVATPFEYKSYGQELEACQRYFRLIGRGMIGMSITTSSFDFYGLWSEMRASPSASLNTTTPTAQMNNYGVITGSSSSVTQNLADKQGSFGTRIDGFSLTAHRQSTFGTTCIEMDSEIA
jgi:hypothetical protein